MCMYVCSVTNKEDMIWQVALTPTPYIWLSFTLLPFLTSGIVAGKGILSSFKIL